MRACVSPPQERVSHIVEVAAIMAQAASTALPPLSKIIAPAVAAKGLPVTAIQCCACSAGFWVRACTSGTAELTSTIALQMAATPATVPLPDRMRCPWIVMPGGEHMADLTAVHASTGITNGNRPGSLRLSAQVRARNPQLACARYRHGVGMGPALDDRQCQRYLPHPAHPSAARAHRDRNC